MPMDSITIVCTPGEKRTLKGKAAASRTMSGHYLPDMLRYAISGVSGLELARQVKVLQKENAELRGELATVCERTGPNFEKVRFITAGPAAVDERFEDER